MTRKQTEAFAITCLRLQDARDEIIVAARCENLREHRLKLARLHLASVFLVGDDHEFDFFNAEDHLADMIADILADFGSETPALAADRIVDELFKHLKPEDV